MRFIDVSMALSSETLAYPGDTPFSREAIRLMEAGDKLNLSELKMGAHTGTHVDAPSHFIRDGKSTDQLPPDAFSGPAVVLELTDVEGPIHREDLEPWEIRGGDVALLKTRNSRHLTPPFREDHVYLAENGANHLVRMEVKAVGIDYLSIEGHGVKGSPVHELLLGRGIGIIEGLDLSEAVSGRFWFLCLPLRVVGGDGAPARAVLVEDWPGM